MPIVWPGSLPQLPELGWAERKLKNTVRSETDTGPAKVRRRFTNAVRRLTLPFILTEAQAATLDNFHTATLFDGVLRFDYVQPRTGLTHSCRFVDAPQFSEPANCLYRTTIELEYQL